MQKIQKKITQKTLFLVNRFKIYFPDRSYGRCDGITLPPSTKKAATKCDC